MLTAGELAGLVAAIFWAILVCFTAVVLVRLARLLAQTAKSLAELNDRLTPLLDDVGRTVGEANRRLAEAEPIADNVRQVSGNLARITSVLSVLLAGPVVKICALGHGVRVAIVRRRRRGTASGATRQAVRLPGPRAEQPAAARAQRRQTVGRGRG